MDMQDFGSGGTVIDQVGRAGKWVAATLLITVITLLTGVGVAAFLGRIGADDTWSRWSAVGQTFGALSTVVSGLALLAFVITFAAQVRELKMQRAELILQGEALERSRIELYRSAEVGIRQLHQELLKIAIEDERLAEVWPPLEPDLPIERNRQYLYANLILHHHLLCLTAGDYSKEQVERNLRYLFRSSLIRKYWRAAATGRKYLTPGTDEHSFSHLADEICQEYEAVLAADRPVYAATGASPPRESVAHRQIDTSPGARPATSQRES